jgi:hypothetical protein
MEFVFSRKALEQAAQQAKVDGKPLGRITVAEDDDGLIFTMELPAGCARAVATNLPGFSIVE